MLKAEFKIFDHLYTSKSVIVWPISIQFFCKKHPIWGKLGAFLAKFSKIHPILQIGHIGYVTITHPSIYQNLRKCTSKPLSIPAYHLSVRTPPPRREIVFACFELFLLLLLSPIIDWMIIIAAVVVCLVCLFVFPFFLFLFEKFWFRMKPGPPIWFIFTSKILPNIPFQEKATFSSQK